jgi:hypothetical protein
MASLTIGQTIILPVVFYGCETWSPTLMEGHRLRIYENWVLRRIFGPMEVVGDWRIMCSEELYNFYASSNITCVIKLRIMRWVGDR